MSAANKVQAALGKGEHAVRLWAWLAQAEGPYDVSPSVAVGSGAKGGGHRASSLQPIRGWRRCMFQLHEMMNLMWHSVNCALRLFSVVWYCF